MTPPERRTSGFTGPRIIVYVGLAGVAFTAYAGALATVEATAAMLRSSPLPSFALLVLLSLLTVWACHLRLRAPGEQEGNGGQMMVAGQEDDDRGGD